MGSIHIFYFCVFVHFPIVACALPEDANPAFMPRCIRAYGPDRQGVLPAQPHRDGQFARAVLPSADQVLRAPPKPP